ncbi:AraC family transcriptional regulator [uncultured Sunxiuqinia sp.]|uniref:AraC family transcriptional regulator n=1 Tax=Sunxiuqinia rutila TaxID=1397841 RepID=UPI002632CFCB|nr:AraC family transcriptional regulator [uncultured Sunxiuqinia sp.]
MHFFYSRTDSDAAGFELLREFPFINDFGFEEYKDIRQKPLQMHYNEGIELCYVTKGRYEWIVGEQKYLLLPGNGFVTCPWEKHGSPREALDLGEIFWMVIKPETFTENGQFYLGNWSRFSDCENQVVGNVLSQNPKHIIQKAQLFKQLFIQLQQELETKEFGYYQRVCNLVEEFLINTVRIIQNRDSLWIENRKWFSNFDAMLKSKLAKKWTLQEMACMNKVGITTLTQLVKEHTGYTPANYLIYIRLEKAKQLLTDPVRTLTSIALDCGFYSSQHFSSTFSKWEGVTPSVFRMKNLSKQL